MYVYIYIIIFTKHIKTQCFHGEHSAASGGQVELRDFHLELRGQLQLVGHHLLLLRQLRQLRQLKHFIKRHGLYT